MKEFTAGTCLPCCGEVATKLTPITSKEYARLSTREGCPECVARWDRLDSSNYCDYCMDEVEEQLTKHNGVLLCSSCYAKDTSPSPFIFGY